MEIPVESLQYALRHLPVDEDKIPHCNEYRVKILEKPQSAVQRSFSPVASSAMIELRFVYKPELRSWFLDLTSVPQIVNVLERNSYTTISSLKAGDRFTFKNDKKQEVWHLLKRKWKKALVINAATFDRGHPMEQLEKWAVEKSYSIAVKFLRSTIE